jgi:hypothetical protein
MSSNKFNLLATDEFTEAPMIKETEKELDQNTNTDAEDETRSRVSVTSIHANLKSIRRNRGIEFKLNNDETIELQSLLNQINDLPFDDGSPIISNVYYIVKSLANTLKDSDLDNYNIHMFEAEESNRLIPEISKQTVINCIFATQQVLIVYDAIGQISGLLKEICSRPLAQNHMHDIIIREFQSNGVLQNVKLVTNGAIKSNKPTSRMIKQLPRMASTAKPQISYSSALKGPQPEPDDKIIMTILIMRGLVRSGGNVKELTAIFKALKLETEAAYWSGVMVMPDVETSGLVFDMYHRIISGDDHPGKQELKIYELNRMIIRSGHK